MSPPRYEGEKPITKDKRLAILLNKKFQNKKSETEEIYKELLEKNEESSVLSKEDMLLLAQNQVKFTAGQMLRLYVSNVKTIKDDDRVKR